MDKTRIRTRLIQEKNLQVVYVNYCVKSKAKLTELTFCVIFFSGDEDLHEIHFYRNRNGIAPVYEYLKELNSRTDKNSRIKAGKVNDYITRLSEEGTFAGLPYVKHIEGDIWELRPLRDRIFFVAWYNGSYVLLHQFQKETQKTPTREIEKARREYEDLKERGL